MNCTFCGELRHEEKVTFKGKDVCEECLFYLSELYDEFNEKDGEEFCPRCDNYFWCECRDEEKASQTHEG